MIYTWPGWPNIYIFFLGIQIDYKISAYNYQYNDSIWWLCIFSKLHITGGGTCEYINYNIYI